MYRPQSQNFLPAIKLPTFVEKKHFVHKNRYKYRHRDSTESLVTYVFQIWWFVGFEILARAYPMEIFTILYPEL